MANPLKQYILDIKTGKTTYLWTQMNKNQQNLLGNSHQFDNNNNTLLQNLRQEHSNYPEWWGVDPDTRLVFYRNTADVNIIKAQLGESGGHHPHGLALGGSTGQTLTLTGDTATYTNPTHSNITRLQKKLY